MSACKSLDAKGLGLGSDGVHTLNGLVESGLGCGSDGVRAKVLVVSGLQKEKGREKEAMW